VIKILTIDEIREQIAKDIAPVKTKKPKSEFFERIDCGNHFKIIWKD